MGATKTIDFFWEECRIENMNHMMKGVDCTTRLNLSNLKNILTVKSFEFAKISSLMIYIYAVKSAKI